MGLKIVHYRSIIDTYCLYSMQHCLCNDVTIQCPSICLPVPSCSRSVQRVCCCGPHGHAVSIDCCTAHLRQAWPPFSPYPQQCGGQQQMREVSCLQRSVCVWMLMLHTSCWHRCRHLSCFVTRWHWWKSGWVMAICRWTPILKSGTSAMHRCSLCRHKAASRVPVWPARRRE